jgi:hypothetical protein
VDVGPASARDALDLGADWVTVALGEPMLRPRVGDRERNNPVSAAVGAPDRVVRVRPLHRNILQRHPGDLSMAAALRGESGQRRDETDEPGEHECADDSTTGHEQPRERACEDRDLPRVMQLETEGDG